MSGGKGRIGTGAGFVVGLLASLCMGAGLPPGPATGQRPAAGEPAGPGQRVGPPPVITFDASGISLEEAVRLTLQHDPNLRLQEVEVRSRLGAVEEQAGVFDLSLAGSFSHEHQVQELSRFYKEYYGATDTVSHNGGFEVDLGKPFRWGASVSPYVDMSYEGTSYRGLAAGALPIPDFGDLYTFHAGVGAAVPLARGLGARAADAGERAAIHEHDAARLGLQHQASLSALSTTLAYWDLHAAQESASIVTRLVEEQAALTELTRGLIEAGELPAVEIARAQAAEARARARLNETQRGVSEAQVTLALAIGVAATGADATLPRTRGAFPATPDAAQIAPPQVAALVGEGLANRRDLAAAAMREQAGTALAQAARLNLRPRADLTASTFLTARQDGGISQAIDRWVGPSAKVSLEAERPFGNNLLRGQMVQRESEVDQLRTVSADLGRQIGLNIVQAVTALRETAERVRQADAAVGFYRTTIEAERERFRTGESTLIDTVLTEQQQTDALLELVSAQQELARQLALLRFETGTLLPGGAVVPEALTTVPTPARRQP